MNKRKIKKIINNINTLILFIICTASLKVQAIDISLPEGLPEGVEIIPDPSIEEYYNTTQYQAVTLDDPEITMHVYGTAFVHPWFMEHAGEMAKNIIGSLNYAEDRLKFDGHKIVVVTNYDPDVPRPVAPGHKNTGNKNYTVINQWIICAESVDTLYPDAAPTWRAWNTPIHEFGHSIEDALDLKDISDEVFFNLDKYRHEPKREVFAWEVEQWFNADLNDANVYDSRFSQEGIVFGYFTSFFDVNNSWQPSCEGAPPLEVRGGSFSYSSLFIILCFGLLHIGRRLTPRVYG